MRLTPLSPACGFRRTLYAWRLDPGPTGPCGQLKVGSLSPGARAGAGSVRGRANREDLSLPPGGSEAGPVGLGLERSSLARRCCELLGTRPAIPACPTLRPCGFNGLKLSCRSRPDLIPPPRGISPSHRGGSKIPSSSPAFRPLSRKGQSPSRCLEGAPCGRFGQARDRPVIHFPPECQWTRVDNSTARRFCENQVRSRCARRRSRRALSLMKPAASRWS